MIITKHVKMKTTIQHKNIYKNEDEDIIPIY